MCPGCGHDRSAQATAIRTRPAALHETAGTFPRAHAHGRRLSYAATSWTHAHMFYGLAAEQQQTNAGMLCRLGGPTCIAGTHVLQAHMLCSTPWADAVWLWNVLRPARAGLGWALPLNGCSQGLVVRGISPPEPCLYTCHTKVFSKVSNSLPIHQYFPAASPYGAQPGGWIGKADCYL